MKKNIRAVVVGCGNMGRIGVRYLLEKGIEIVGAYGVNPKTLGADLGLHAGLGRELGIRISSDLDELLEETKPDVAVHAMYSTMADNEAVFTTLLRHGVNIVTTCDDSHYAWQVEPEVCKRLDRIGKEHGATLVGTGIQDVFFLNLGYAAAGASVSLNEIEVSITNNLDDYGLTSAKGCGVGLTEDEFRKMMASRGDAPSAMTAPIVDAICDRFGLTSVHQTLSQVPMLRDHEMRSTALDRKIPAGMVSGLTEQTTAETREGIIVRCSYGLYIYDEGEIDTVTWQLHGEPDCTIQVPGCKTPEGTMATLINRIPDAIAAAPGYLPCSRLEPAKFQL